MVLVFKLKFEVLTKFVKVGLRTRMGNILGLLVPFLFFRGKEESKKGLNKGVKKAVKDTGLDFITQIPRFHNIKTESFMVIVVTAW